MQGPIELGGGARHALLVHGFTGTPWELRPLAEWLAERGWHVRVPLLPGHGTTPGELAATSWRDWYGAIEAEAAGLADGARIALGGLSLGGLLVLHLAHERPRLVSSVAALAAAIRLVAPAALGLRLYARARRSYLAPLVARLHSVKKRVGSDVTDAMLRQANPGYREVPLAPLESLLELGAVVRSELPAILAPTLVVHGRRDHTVPFASSYDLCRALGATAVRHVALDHSCHQLGVDVERERMASEVSAWFAAHAVGGGSG